MLSKITEDLGHSIPDFPLDGKFHRFSADDKNKQPLWAVGVEFEYGPKKENIKFVHYGNWKTGENFSYCNVDYESRAPKFKKVFNKNIAAISEAVDNEKIIKQTECAEKSKILYDSLYFSDQPHDYIVSKNLTKNYNAKSNQNTLLIPCYNVDLEIVGLQKIYKNAENLKFDKRFTTGIKKRGAFMMPEVFDLTKISYAYLCEGYATACSIYEATGMPTIACIDSGNMYVCIALIRQKNSSLNLILCADDDFVTKQKTGKNPGLDAAYKCKGHFPNIILKKPTFISKINETDFNDLHMLEGIETVKTQLTFDYGDFNDIEVLGHENHDKIFFYSTQSLKTIVRTFPQISKQGLLPLAESKFWGIKYNAYKKECAEGDDPIIWSLVCERILTEARNKGEFSTETIRGLGVWAEENGPAINLGNRIFQNNEFIDIGKFRSKYRYQSGKTIELKTDGNIDLMMPLLKLNFKKDGHEILMAGWLTIAPIYSLFDWRPHLWLNGPRGTGKSTIMKWFSDLTFNSMFIIDSTAAGIRQTIKTNAHPIFIDEAEPDDHEGKNRVNAIIDMARQSSSNGGAQSYRGTASGEAYKLSTNSIFMFGSITNSLEKKSDVSRFMVIELDQPKNQSHDDYVQLKKEFESICPSSWMMNSIKNFPQIKKNIEIIKVHLRTKFDSRQCDQLAPILAGYYSIDNKGDIPSDMIKAYLDCIDLKEFKQDNEETESESVLDSILSVICDRHNNLNVEMCLIQRRVSDLAILGIKDCCDGKHIFISSKNIHLSKALEHCNKQNYAKFLRLDERNIRTTQRVNSRVAIGLKIPIAIEYFEKSRYQSL